MRRYWVNIDNRLFRIEDAPVYMHMVGVKVIFPEKGRAIFYGALPEHKDLAQKLEGKSVEIVRGECGRPDDYYESVPIICLRHCKTRTSWMPDPVVLLNEEHSLMFIYVSVDCEVEFYEPKA